MSTIQRNGLILSLGIALGLLLALGHGVLAQKNSGRAAPLPLDDLRTFVEILNRVKSDYVEPVEDETLIENSIRGMLDGLDPHSAYLSPEEFREVNISTTGKFGGLGIEVQMQNGFVRVVAPIDDTPAAKAGIQAGDLIIRIDNIAVKGLSLIEAVKILRGEPGTKVTLTLLRESVEQPFKVELTRDIIKVKSVKSKLLEPGFGYLRVTQFSTETGQSLVNEFDKLKKENKGELNGIVLDLRNNPGGVLNAAVEVSDAFLDDGTVVSIKGRLPDANQDFNATRGDIHRGRPLVVLVNGGSASASEIVAGAIQDHGRGVIMGSPTFGKGSVQTILPLQNDAALKLTTARYYTPKGRSIQAQGIEPDVAIRQVTVTASKDSEFEPFKEADLAGRLKNENGDPKPDKDKGDKDDDGPGISGPPQKNGDEKPLVESDYALYEALNLLKGMYILRTPKTQTTRN